MTKRVAATHMSIVRITTETKFDDNSELLRNKITATTPNSIRSDLNKENLKSPKLSTMTTMSDNDDDDDGTARFPYMENINKQ